MEVRFGKDAQCSREGIKCYRCKEVIPEGADMRFEYARTGKATPWCKPCADRAQIEGSQPDGAVRQSAVELVSVLSRIEAIEQALAKNADISSLLNLADEIGRIKKRLSVLEGNHTGANELPASDDQQAASVDLFSDTEIPF